jgi:hypothetical protein
MARRCRYDGLGSSSDGREPVHQRSRVRRLPTGRRPAMFAITLYALFFALFAAIYAFA